MIARFWTIPCFLAGLLPAPAARAMEPADAQFFGDTFVSDRVLEVTGSSREAPRLLAGVRALLDGSKLNVVNFEGAATTSSQAAELKQYLLRMPPEAPAILKAGGIQVATLANNHSLDFGPAGLTDTLQLLQKADIKTTGAGPTLAEASRPLEFDLGGGKRLCILAYSRTLPEGFWATNDRPGTAYGDTVRVVAQVKTCAEANFFTVATFHWGRELMTTPLDYQRELAKAAIDAGANLVIGHHPHVLQELEIYRGRPILYSLGNFAFGSLPRSPAAEGLAVRLRLSGNPRVFALDLVPLLVRNDQVAFVPRPLAPGEADPLQDRLPEAHPCRPSVQGRFWSCLFELND